MSTDLGQRFAARTVAITGGSSGIGLAVARRIAAEGGRVALIARGEARLQEAVASLPGSGHVGRVADAANEEALTAVAKEWRESLGTIDALACCAGGHAVRPLAVSKARNFEELYQQNVVSAANAVRLLAKSFPAAGGSVVFLSSVAGLRGAAGASAYAAAKGALLALTRSLAIELAGRRTRVNCVLPGVVETPMTAGFLGALPLEQKEALVRSHPLGLGQPEDVAAAICFLLSDDARWITGAELVIDGGLSAR